MRSRFEFSPTIYLVISMTTFGGKLTQWPGIDLITFRLIEGPCTTTLFKLLTLSNIFWNIMYEVLLFF